MGTDPGCDGQGARRGNLPAGSSASCAASAKAMYLLHQWRKRSEELCDRQEESTSKIACEDLASSSMTGASSFRYAPKNFTGGPKNFSCSPKNQSCAQICGFHHAGAPKKLSGAPKKLPCIPKNLSGAPKSLDGTAGNLDGAHKASGNKVAPVGLALAAHKASGSNCNVVAAAAASNVRWNSLGACKSCKKHLGLPFACEDSTAASGHLRGGGNRAFCDFLLDTWARYGGAAGRAKVAIEMGAIYWLRALFHWICKEAGLPRYRKPPLFWTWSNIMGKPIFQPAQANGEGDGPCAICSCLVCLEAHHRLAFERVYGALSFPYRIGFTQVGAFKYICQEVSIWKPEQGTFERAVLSLIQCMKGVPTVKVDGWKDGYLDVKTIEYCPNVTQQFSPCEIAAYIYEKGPIIGSLRIGEDYYSGDWETQAYQGAEGDPNHTVVCFGYIMPEEQADLMYIQVMENHRDDGPVRWILYSAFRTLTFITVEPLDRNLLEEKKKKSWLRSVLSKVLFFL